MFLSILFYAVIQVHQKQILIHLVFSRTRAHCPSCNTNKGERKNEM